MPSDEGDRLVKLARDYFGYSDVRDYQVREAYTMLNGIDSKTYFVLDIIQLEVQKTLLFVFVNENGCILC